MIAILISSNSFKMYGRSFENGFVEPSTLLLAFPSIDMFDARTGIPDFVSGVRQGFDAPIEFVIADDPGVELQMIEEIDH